MKDNFSKRSHLYARFRPTYPRQLFEFLISLVPERQAAWDCGTGNGQVAAVLAGYFDKVYATDISENQIKHAVEKPNVVYKIEAAEQTSFPDELFDLITVAQAVHWFDFSRILSFDRLPCKTGESQTSGRLARRLSDQRVRLEKRFVLPPRSYRRRWVLLRHA